MSKSRMILSRTKESLLLGRLWLSQWFARPRFWPATAAIALALSCGCGESPYHPAESPADFYFAGSESDRCETAPTDKRENRMRDVAIISTTKPLANSPYWEFRTDRQGPLLRRLPIVVTDPYAARAHSPSRSTVFDPVPQPECSPLASSVGEDAQSLPEASLSEAVDSTIAVMLLPPIPTEASKPDEAAPLDASLPKVKASQQLPVAAEDSWQNAPFDSLPDETIPEEAISETAIAEARGVPAPAESGTAEFAAERQTPSEATFVGTQDQQDARILSSLPTPPLTPFAASEQSLAEPTESTVEPTAESEDDALASADPLPPAIATGVLTGAKVNEQAIAKIRRGYQLASRGAYYAARAEFIGVLRMISQAKDAKHGRPRRTIALAAGLRALEEAADFAPHGNALDAELNVEVIATSHRTRLDDDPTSENLLPQQMMDRYLRYAQLKLGGSVAGEPAGSMALHALGKLHSQLGRLEPEKHALAHRIAYAYQQAALMAHNENHLAAHELGVLMAESGHYLEARDLLVQVAERQPHPTVLRNLARVEKQLGETTLAAATRDRARSLEQQTSETEGVAWVSPSDFAAIGNRDVPLTTQTPYAAARPAPHSPNAPGQAWRR